MSGTKLHGILCTACRPLIMYDDECAVLGWGIPGDGDEWHFEGLVTVVKLERTWVCGKLREVQIACSAERCRVPSFVIEAIETAATVGTAWKKKAVL